MLLETWENKYFILLQLYYQLQEEKMCGIRAARADTKLSQYAWFHSSTLML